MSNESANNDDSSFEVDVDKVLRQIDQKVGNTEKSQENEEIKVNNVDLEIESSSSE